MKKVVFMLATVLVAGAIASSATATGPIAVEEGFPCLIFDQDGNLVLADESFQVWRANGDTYLRCEGQVGNDTGAVIEDSGFLCNIAFSGLTTNSTSRIGRGGESQLTCRGHADPSAASVASSGTAGAVG